MIKFKNIFKEFIIKNFNKKVNREFNRESIAVRKEDLKLYPVLKKIEKNLDSFKLHTKDNFLWKSEWNKFKIMRMIDQNNENFQNLYELLKDQIEFVRLKIEFNKIKETYPLILSLFIQEKSLFNNEAFQELVKIRNKMNHLLEKYRQEDYGKNDLNLHDNIIEEFQNLKENFKNLIAWSKKEIKDSLENEINLLLFNKNLDKLSSIETKYRTIKVKILKRNIKQLNKEEVKWTLERDRLKQEYKELKELSPNSRFIKFENKFR